MSWYTAIWELCNGVKLDQSVFDILDTAVRLNLITVAQAKDIGFVAGIVYPDTDVKVEKQEEFIMVAGYEAPANTSIPARKVLEKLFSDGMVIFQYDDGPAVLVREELVNIAGAIGIVYHDDPYSLMLIDKHRMSTFYFWGLQR
jgi:hypothetical protein